MTQEVLPRVAKCVANVLALDPEKLRPDSRLIEELGADSLDLVELMYLLEEEFSITLSKQDMSLTAQLGLAEEKIHQNEVLTPLALEKLRERFPESKEMFVPGITRKHLAVLVTVEEISRMVIRKLHEGRCCSRPLPSSPKAL